jgi:hypothetical protein
MEKIVFLDFDGVVRFPVFTGEWPPDAEFSETHLARIAELVRGSDARVGISSTWRLRLDRGGILSALGNRFPAERLHGDWATPDLSSTHGELPRGEEIETWLSAHPGVTRFVILDDLPHARFDDPASFGGSGGRSASRPWKRRSSSAARPKRWAA